MNPREEAERLFSGMSGAEWNRNAAISGVGWALLALADAIVFASGKAPVEKKPAALDPLAGQCICRQVRGRTMPVSNCPVHGVGPELEGPDE